MRTPGMTTDSFLSRSPDRSNQVARWIVFGLIGLAIALVIGSIGTYNRLVASEQAVRSQWGQVENVYQRRADLVPNLVATVKGAASFEKDTFTAVAEARARVGQVNTAGADKVLNDPAALQRFAQAQDGLGSALSRLLVVAERYPELKATAAFRDLQAQLEGTENRIAVERMRFNEAAQTFNTKRQSFPTVLLAGLFGERFREKAYFEARPGAAQPPEVKF
jgi:LemA protein